LEGGGFEATADYAERSGACVALLAAVLQADAPSPAHSGFGAPSMAQQPGPLLPQAWALLARLLNKLPPTRLVAVALEAVLEMARIPCVMRPDLDAPSDAFFSACAQAGWRLSQAYGRQFGKVLEVVRSDFLPRLAASGEKDMAPLLTRLGNYLGTAQHAQQPEGRALPDRDESSLRKA